MSKPIINCIDVSEEIRYCNNCSNLGLDFKAGKFYCSLIHRPDELPEVLSCDEFRTNCYIKRLQEENKRLQMLSCANCGEKYLSPDGSELYEKNVQLQKENEELGKIINCKTGTIQTLAKIRDDLKQKNEELKNRLKTLDDEEFVYEVTEIEYNNFKKMNKYKQALEEIKKEANRLLYEENPIYGYNNSNYFELLAKYVLAKIDEVLNDRD